MGIRRRGWRLVWLYKRLLKSLSLTLVFVFFCCGSTPLTHSPICPLWQVANQAAMAVIPLVMEPRSQFYESPVRIRHTLSITLNLSSAPPTSSQPCRDPTPSTTSYLNNSPLSATPCHPIPIHRRARRPDPTLCFCLAQPGVSLLCSSPPHQPDMLPFHTSSHSAAI